MKYVGSKARIAKHIVPIIQQQIDSKDCSLYIEPFVGGANVLTYIQCATKLGIDISLPLITLLRHVTERGGASRIHHKRTIRRHTATPGTLPTLLRRRRWLLSQLQR